MAEESKEQKVIQNLLNKLANSQYTESLLEVDVAELQQENMKLKQQLAQQNNNVTQGQNVMKEDGHNGNTNE